MAAPAPPTVALSFSTIGTFTLGPPTTPEAYVSQNSRDDAPLRVTNTVGGCLHVLRCLLSGFPRWRDSPWRRHEMREVLLPYLVAEKPAHDYLLVSHGDGEAHVHLSSDSMMANHITGEKPWDILVEGAQAAGMGDHPSRMHGLRRRQRPVAAPPPTARRGGCRRAVRP